MCLLSATCVAQSGVLNISQDSRIDALMMKQRQIHENDSTISGFRVQIFMDLGNDALERAEIMKAEFEENYPDIPIHLLFGQPYYRLRVGDFRTRLEAERLHQRLVKEYKNAFVTADRIELPYNPLCAGVEDLENNDTIPTNDTIMINIDESVIDQFFYDD